MNRTKKVLIVIGVLFMLLQLFQPKRNNNLHVSSKDISVLYQAPGSVKAILKSSCYDCHSNDTQYPWYTYIQPLGLWMDHHIKEGKAKLNLSEFGDYSARRQNSKLKAIAQSVEDNEMPLSSYTLVHTSAKLSLTEKKQLLNWVDTVRDNLSTNTP